MDDPLTYRIPAHVVADTHAALAERGAEGFEAVVVWVAREQQRADVEVLQAVVPPQIALRGEDGLAVMIPDWAVSELITSLPPGTYIPIRVHSHPRDAFHSSTDDLNRLLSHRGAVSIVVPDFARAALDLGGCSVNELGTDFEWRELDPDEIARRFLIV